MFIKRTESSNNMGGSPEWGLRLRMVASVLLLFLVTTGFLLVVWVIILFFALLFTLGSSQATSVATMFTGVFAALIVALEFTQRHSIAQRTEAEPVTIEEFPDLYRHVAKIAQQYDIPVPQIAVSNRREPKALVVGYRQKNTLLILSEGTMETLTDSELEAVLAHELAHIANRDAMVMTAVSLPVMLANGLRSRLWSIITQSPSSTQKEDSVRGSGWGIRARDGARSVIVTFLILSGAKLLLFTVSTVAWILARTVVAVLSRSRELVADRAAAELLGSPSQLSSALVSLDDSVDELPRQDLREVWDISAMSIVPLEPVTAKPEMLGPEGNGTPFLWSVRAPLRRAFRTHPRTETRIERLSSFETRRHS